VYRATSLLVLILSLAALAAPNLSTTQDEQIKKAIEELGSGRFAVREKAKKLLIEIGAPAEPFLVEAAKNTDEEVANSAKTILENFRWGLYPDTPKRVRELIEQFRSGTLEERKTSLAALVREKPVPYATVRKLIEKVNDAESRQQLLQQLYADIRRAIPDVLARGDHDSAEMLLNLALAGGSPKGSAADYAVFMHLRGKLDDAIKLYDTERKQPGEKGKKAAGVLVYLYRIKGDWAAARKAAEDTKEEQLVELALWQSGDWKSLATSSYKHPIGNQPGFLAAYDRLAGNAKDFDEKIKELRDAASKDEPETFRQDIDALLLNRKAAEAISIMSDKKKELSLAFDLLCAQMKHKEAFDLVNEARRRDTDPNENKEIRVRRARMLYLLGDKDAAQLFNVLADEIKANENASLARNLLKAEVRVGLRDVAANHAAKFIDEVQKAGQNHSIETLLDPLFSDEKAVAEAWWMLFRKEQAMEDSSLAMKRLQNIMAGKLAKKDLEAWTAKMQKEPIRQQVEFDRRGRQISSGIRNHSIDAVAGAWRAAGDDAKAEEFLKQAAQKLPTAERWIAHGDFLMAKKKYKAAAESYAKATEVKPIDIDVGDEIELFIPFQQTSRALPTYLQGRALLLDGNVKEAKRLIELAHWLPLGNDEVRAKLVDELNKREWPEMARKEAEFLYKCGWYDNFAYGNVLSFLARHAAKDGDFFKAADLYEKCVVGCMRTGANFVEPTAYLLVPESIRAYRCRGLFATGKIEEGLREAMANLEVMSGNIELAVKVVPDLMKLGKKKEADAIYEKVRAAISGLSKDHPESAYAHNSTAWLMANCRRELDEALVHASKAVKLEPKNAGYIDTLAEVHFRKGDRDKAISLMKQCAELTPKNAYFRKQLVRFKNQPFDSPTPDEGEEDD
jgi:hypothetical protein